MHISYKGIISFADFAHEVAHLMHAEREGCLYPLVQSSATRFARSGCEDVHPRTNTTASPPCYCFQLYQPLGIINKNNKNSSRFVQNALTHIIPKDLCSALNGDWCRVHTNRRIYPVRIATWFGRRRSRSIIPTQLKHLHNCSFGRHLI